MKKKHSLAWWLLVGWWWYLLFAWWIYPIKWLLTRKSKKEEFVEDDSYRLLEETETAIIDFLEKSNDRTALQVNVKNSLARKLEPYFDEAVRNLYQRGMIKTSKDGGRVRLELV